MSTIASFIRLPRTAIAGLRQAAMPKKTLFGGKRDTFHDYLGEHGHPVTEFQWSGYVLAVLLPYLEESSQIDFKDAEGDELATFLADARKASFLIVTSAHKAQYLDKLNAPFSEVELRDYFNAFNETNESEIGKAMLSGIQCLRECITAVDESSIILCIIG